MGTMKALTDRNSTGFENVDTQGRSVGPRVTYMNPRVVETNHGYVQRYEQPPQKNTPWGKIISGVVVCMFLVLTFASWALKEVLAFVEKQSQRSHELSLEAIELGKVAAKGAAASLPKDQPHDPSVVFLFIVAFLVLFCMYKVISK